MTHFYLGPKKACMIHGSLPTGQLNTFMTPKKIVFIGRKSHEKVGFRKMEAAGSDLSQQQVRVTSLTVCWIHFSSKLHSTRHCYGNGSHLGNPKRAHLP